MIAQSLAATQNLVMISTSSVSAAPLALASPIFHMGRYREPVDPRGTLATILRFDAAYGSGPDKVGLVLECGEQPWLTAEDFVALYGENHDGAIGDPYGVETVSVTHGEWVAEQTRRAESERVAAAERLDKSMEELDWDAEYAMEMRDLERHNREAMGYGSW